MLHLIKYRFKQNLRDISSMFWALAFPIILGTFFYFAFASSGLASTGEAEWEPVKVAVIEEDSSSENASVFLSFLEQLDPETLNIQDISSESAALHALNEGDITGIFYVRETPALTVSKSGLNESILTALLDNYNQSAAMLQKITSSHPEHLEHALEVMSDYKEMTKETSLGGKSMNPSVQYFFALIAYACLSGAFLGIRSSFDSQANLSPLGMRRSITPTHRLTLICIDMFVLVAIHFINMLILNLYIIKVLGISLGDNLPALLLVNLMGSIIGVCIGITLGCVSRLSIDLKYGLTVAITLFPGFLAGLMFGNMKNIIELHCPIINRINPAAVLSDAFYCMGIYNDMQRFTRCILILAVMSILLLAVAFFSVRRERYDSI
ncbi:ABC transporter permease [Dorea sp. YH-dor228]|uniref:ABC transporter permease n=1 Tax=Dorea sp. YH-dor228 TaxID=3151120 RepID=UPI0032429BFF